MPSQIVVGGGNAHAGLRLAVGAEHATGFEADLGEFSVLQVLVQSDCGGIVGDIDVGPAVVVEIGDAYTESVGAA